jgi:PAP2 superfamily
MNSLVVSLFAAWYMTEHGMVPAWLAYTTITLWVAWIGLARVYMGLHTPIDIIGGIAAGLVLMVLWSRLWGESSCHLIAYSCIFKNLLIFLNGNEIKIFRKVDGSGAVKPCFSLIFFWQTLQHFSTSFVVLSITCFLSLFRNKRVAFKFYFR